MSLSSNKIEESKENNENKNTDINKNLYFKFITIKNALIEERQKTSLLEKENNYLKEENQKKDITILELKDEIKKYHECIDQKSNSNFFSELFQNINFSDIKNESTINKLTDENFNLKEQISNLKTELDISKTNIEKIIAKSKEETHNFEEKIKLYETEIKNYNKNNEISNQKILELEKRNIGLEQAIQALNSDKKNFEETLIKLKKEIKQKNQDMEKLIKDQENIINNNTEFKQKINNLKKIISQYKKAIDNTTEINSDYIFIGKIIPNTHYNNIININNEVNADIFLKVENKINNINQENFEKIKIMFNFDKKKIKISVDNKNSINLEAKDIIDIVENLHIEGQIKIFYKIKEQVFDYLCQFTKKEAFYIIQFYKELKNNDHIDPALYAAYLGTQ